MFTNVNLDLLHALSFVDAAVDADRGISGRELQKLLQDEMNVSFSISAKSDEGWAGSRQVRGIAK